LNNASYVAFYPWPKNSQVRFYGQRTHSGPLSFYEAAMPFPLAPFVSNVGGATELCNGVPTYLFGATSGSGYNAGTTSAVGYTPWSGVASQAAGDITTDNDLQWVCQGTATWAANAAYIQFQVGETLFSVIEDSNGNMQVAIQGGNSGGTAPNWGTGYGEQTADGSVIWVCVGRSMGWTASTIWYLPIQGFFPPEVSQPYGGAEIIFGGNVQAVVDSGISGGVIPPFSPTLGNYTNDNSSGSPANGLVWLNIATVSVNSLTWTKGHVYAYSFKCRTATDFYAVNVPPGRNTPNGPYKGGGTGAISTASPVFTIVGGNAGAVNTIGGEGSTDPQVDTIVIWRDADGGGLDNMFELTEIPAPPPKANVAQPWFFDDYLPDVPTAVYPGLNILIPAPIADSNNPPPSGFLPMAWHFQRIWGGDQTVVDFSGGPDVVTGNPQEAFNPILEFPFLSIVTDAIHTPAGLVVMLQTDIECIYGGPSTASFFSTTLCPGKGCLSFNAISTLGGETYMFTSDRQCLVMTPALQISRIGFPIGDKLVKFDASKVYLTVHDDGNDNAVILADGVTGFYRLNPHQVPQGDAIWSPFRQIAGGCKMVQSITVAPGVNYLLIGSTSNNQTILRRDLTTWSDGVNNFVPLVELGSASQYAILAYSGITNVGSTVVTGGVIGSFPTASITGFPPGVATIVPATAQNQFDLANAIFYYQSLPSVAIGGSFANTTFVATDDVTVFAASSTLHFTGGTVTFDGGGFSNPLFVFLIGSAMTVDTAPTTVTFTNGATAANVVWVAESSVTFDAHPHMFAGNILAHTSITLNGGTLTGRALANTGAVSISNATNITVPSGTVGTPYESNFEIGAITLADAGETAHLRFIQMDFANAGTRPRVFVSLDNPSINPSWTELTTIAYESAQIYGQTQTPPYFPIRYYFAPNLAVCRRIRIKVEYGNTDTVKNELYGFSINGNLVAEK
jgi:hypothetical protein